MKMLLIEDNDNKRLQIETFLRQAFITTEIFVAKSLQSGLKSVKSVDPNLVLLDMSLPAFDISPNEDGFQHLSYAGREFLEHLDLQGVHPFVIVITAFDQFGVGKNVMTLFELNAELQAEYGDVYLGSVSYSPVIDEWQVRLKALIDKVLPIL